jgi:microcystin-dependent protein
MAWNRWNTGTHIFEYSNDLGVTWLPLPIKASATFFEDQIPVHFGGTGSDLIATGGPGKVLKQVAIGAPVIVERLSYDELAGDPPTSFPTGTVHMFAGVVGMIPNGYLLCDGSAINRVTFGKLFGVIGVTWGVGDGSTTFNLPDLRSRSPVGAGQGSGLTNRVLATTFGEENHLLSIAELPAHHHSYSLYNVANVFVANGANPLSIDTFTTVNTGDTGSGSTHNNMQPSFAINFIIRT